MDEDSGQSVVRTTLEADVASLVRSVRRQTVAIWSLVAVLVVAFGAPWITYFLHSRESSERATSSSLGSEDAELAFEEPFDNDFHARPVEEKVKRATAILLTRLEKAGETHREVVVEIIKNQPDVRLYYNVGDEYERLSHRATPSCEGCEGQGQVVFMLGNPASMASSFSYEGERVQGMGDMPLNELRKLAGASVSAQQQ